MTHGNASDLESSYGKQTMHYLWVGQGTISYNDGIVHVAGTKLRPCSHNSHYLHLNVIPIRAIESTLVVVPRHKSHWQPSFVELLCGMLIFNVVAIWQRRTLPQHILYTFQQICPLSTLEYGGQVIDMETHPHASAPCKAK